MRSRSERDEFKAHVASGRVEALKTPGLVGLFLSLKDAHIKGHPVSEQVPDNSGQSVGHGGNGLGSAEFGAQAPVFVPQIAFIMVQGGGRHPQRVPKAILALPGCSAQHFAGAGVVVGAQAEPGTQMLCTLKGTEVITKLAHNGNAG